VNANDLYHTGLVVDELDAAKAFLSDTAGYRWGLTVGADVAILTPAGERTVPMRITYSADEPRLELVQSIPETIWQPADSGVHHLGYWSDDVDDDVARLVDTDMAVEARAASPDGASMWAYCKGAHGPRIELVSRSMEPMIRTLFDPTRA
jgi:hypothetical protein